MAKGTGELRQEALDAVEALVVKAVAYESALRVLAHFVGERLGVKLELVDLDILVERILECVPQKEAASGDSPPKAADHQDS